MCLQKCVHVFYLVDMETAKCYTCVADQVLCIHTWALIYMYVHACVVKHMHMYSCMYVCTCIATVRIKKVSPTSVMPEWMD